MTFSSESLEGALELLGELLADRGTEVEVVAIGGGSLLLLGLIARPTKDLDIVAVVTDGRYASAKPLPEFLASAVRDVAAATGLRDDWLNGGPTSLLDFGLPEGFENRTTTRRFGGLVIHLAGRKDQIFFKLIRERGSRAQQQTRSGPRQAFAHTERATRGGGLV